MEYAIAGGVTALFVIIYLLTRPAMRERFTAALKEEELAARARECAENLGMPSDGGKEPYTAAMKRAVMRALSHSARAADDGALEHLRSILRERKEDLEKLAKEDFSALGDLPYAKGEARAVTLARLVLENSRYIFCADRAETVIGAFNAVHTLTFSEIEQMEKAFRFVLFEKLAFLCARITKTEKVMRAAGHAAKHPRLATLFKTYKAMRGVIFSRFCAEELGYDITKFRDGYLALADETAFYLSNVIDAVDNIEIFDFSSYYAPVSVLREFDAYVSATPDTRAAFMKKLGELSGAENLDEYAYALRLRDYGGYGMLPPLRTLRFTAGKGSVVSATAKGDLTLLARALSSPEMMQLFFGGKKKSIIKKAKIKSSFMPKTRNVLADFGVRVDGDSLSVCRALPEGIVSVRCAIEHSGTVHEVEIVRGAPPLTVNGTVMSGVPAVTLGDIPLHIVAGADTGVDKGF